MLTISLISIIQSSENKIYIIEKDDSWQPLLSSMTIGHELKIDFLWTNINF